jgi:hypothetical protein
MNLICFPNFTAGGLMCDLLNNTTNKFDGITLKANLAHSFLKLNDNGRVCRTFNKEYWDKRLNGSNILLLITETLNKDLNSFYIGTHCHPSCIPIEYLNKFNKVISITTESQESKFFRYIRMCHGLPSTMAEHNADNVIESFESNPNCINIEFVDIVNGKYVIENNLNYDHYANWKKINPFLYSIEPKLLDTFIKIAGEVNV